MTTDGWDMPMRPGSATRTWHWFVTGFAECGAMGPMSHKLTRQKRLPPRGKRNGRVCKNCLKRHPDVPLKVVT